MNKIKKLFNLIVIFIFAFSVNCFADIPPMTELYEQLTSMITANNIFNGGRYNVSSAVRSFMNTEGKLWSDQVPEEYWGISSGAVTSPTLYKYNNQYYLILKTDPYIINYIDEQGQDKTITIYGIFDSDSYYVKDKIVLMRNGTKAKYNAYYFDEEGVRSAPIRNANGEAVKFESNGTLSGALAEEDTDINEDDDEMGGVALTTNNPAKQKATQVAARRTACMSALIAATNNDGMNSITMNDNSVGLNVVNLTSAHLFADECVYPFSYFNWPAVADKSQFYVWINMENNLTHANWTCTETKTETPVCYKDHGDGECHLNTTPKITIKAVTKKCNAQAWNPKLWFSFGRTYDMATPGLIGHLGGSGSAPTETQFTGSWVAGGFLLYYPVYWSPTSTNYWGEYTGDFPHFYNMLDSFIRHRIWGAGEQLIKEVKKYGGDENSEEGEVESDNGVTHNIEDFVDYDSIAEDWWNNTLIPAATLNVELDDGTSAFDYYQNMTGLNIHSSMGKPYSMLNSTQKSSVVDYVKNNVQVSEDDLDFDWDY